MHFKLTHHRNSLHNICYRKLALNPARNDHDRDKMTMVMNKTIPAGEFKAKCLALLDEVQDSHSEIIVTKRGKPVAKLVPLALERSKSTLGQLSGTVKINCSLEDLFATGEVWNE